MSRVDRRERERIMWEGGVGDASPLERGDSRRLAERRLVEAWNAVADGCGGDGAAFTRRWLGVAERWRFDDVNELIARHNRYYPIEARLAMDPRTGDFVRLGGERYERHPLDAGWILGRFPAELTRAA
jgi:hypothetical protein